MTSTRARAQIRRTAWANGWTEDPGHDRGVSLGLTRGDRHVGVEFGSHGGIKFAATAGRAIPGPDRLGKVLAILTEAV